MAQIPDFLRQQIIGVIYERFDRLHWEQLQDDERSEQYAAFIDDPEIGARLLHYKDESGIRVWIKDGPAKEYRRAIEGYGSYAKYTNRRMTSIAELTEQALGIGWSVKAETTLQKPMRCEVEHENGTYGTVLWGPPSSFKDLFWHASLIRANGASRKLAIIVTRVSTAELPAARWNHLERLAGLIDASCHQVTRNVTHKS